jgi:hypothetical protein
MQTQIEKTSSLYEIREFLYRENCAPPPWVAPESAVEALYALLSERRGDDRFWSELKELTTRLADRRFDPSHFGSCDVLSHVTVDRLIDDLRAELGNQSGDCSGRSLGHWLCNTVGAAALAGFLLLGTAVGCDDGGGGESSDNESQGGALCVDAVTAQVEGADGEIFCELVNIVNTSALSDQTRSVLLDCLPDLDAMYRAQLLETFETMADPDLADYLTSMASSTGVCGDPGGDSDTDTH